MIKIDDVAEHGKNVSQLTPSFESPIGRFAHFGGEAQRQQIHEIDFAFAVTQADNVASATPAFAQGFDRVIHTTSSEVTQKRISCSERQKPKGRAASPYSFREKAVNNFVGGAVAAYRQKISDPVAVCLPREVSGLARFNRLTNINLNTEPSHAVKRRCGKSSTSAAACRGIYDREKPPRHRVWHSVTAAPAPIAPDSDESVPQVPGALFSSRP